jgi:hypothetical protein
MLRDIERLKILKKPSTPAQTASPKLGRAQKNPTLCTTKPFLGSIAIFSSDATDSIIL